VAAAAAAPEFKGVPEQNAARVAQMSAEEVEEAKAELAQRFSPGALDFLRHRQLNKQRQRQQPPPPPPPQQQQQQQQQSSPADSLKEDQQRQQQQGGESSAAAAAAVQPDVSTQPRASDASVPPASVPPAVSAAARASASAAVTSAAVLAAGNKRAGAAGLAKGFLGSKPGGSSSSKGIVQQHCSSADLQSAVTASKSGSVKSQQNAPSPPAAAAAAGDNIALQHVNPQPPVARLRFSLDGQVLELSGPQTPPTPDEEVLMRDSISRAAGAVPNGYTLPEMRVLVRSSHAPQRAAGFRMLAAVLRRAQPNVLHVCGDGHLIQQEVLLEAELAVDTVNWQQQQAQQGPVAAAAAAAVSSRATGVLWTQIWEYSVVALRAVLLCRLSLDDDNSQVLAAACDCLRVLLGRSSSELLLDEVAAATASLSWPLSWRCNMRRITKGGVWDSVEGLVKAAAVAQQQQQQVGFLQQLASQKCAELYVTA
jgi:hypothetical protein